MSFLGGYGKAWKTINGAALSGGTSLLGMGGGGDPGAQQLAQILGTLKQAKSESDLGYAKAGAQLDAQVPAIQKAYKMQGENLRYLADKSKENVAAREASQIARTNAAVNAAGGGSSNIRPLATRGVVGDTNAALSRIDELFGQHFGDLATGEASDLSRVASQKANLTAQGVGAGNSLYGAMADAYGHQQFVPKKNLWDVLGGVAPIIGTFAGLGAGGGGGGGYAAQPSGGVF
jgi:hypothetical protein